MRRVYRQGINKCKDVTKHKSLYKESVEAPAQAVALEMEELLTTVTKRPMSGKLFRIYRDVRFSQDKTPYNIHIHMSFFCADGNASECGAQPAFHFGPEPKDVQNNTRP
ncbi:MAG: DUF2461 family protein [Planctomycetes bacterium]|nr:DUF2461 family protein [Planctomycetota bacterium]